MRYQIDHDYHIHTVLSTCSRDETQTAQTIAAHARDRGIRRVCIANHFWDETLPCEFRNNGWFEKQNFAHISGVKPLPGAEGVELLFACETDMDNNDTIGISPARYDEFAFIVVPTTHFHMVDGPKWEDRSPAALAKHWIQRLDKVLDSSLPMHKTGIAHLACHLICRGDRAGLHRTLDRIPTAELERLFAKAARKGAGIELNLDDMRRAMPDENDSVLRIFRTAKACGCKFYLASDAHNHQDMCIGTGPMEWAIEKLELTEDDKFVF